jgi:hypothetical protein
MNNGELVQSYLKLWNNRKSPTEVNQVNWLKQQVKQELLDENSHPRIRKTVPEKFLLCTNRIQESSLTENEKKTLVSLYREVMDQL